MEFVEPSAALFLSGTPILDVRAPVEFRDAAVPSATNLPLLNDEERHVVGIEYKTKGNDAAMALGHRLVSGELKARRIEDWRAFLHAHPEAVISCFRGGTRSALVQSWLAEGGQARARVAGGYKAMRQFLLHSLENARRPLLVVAGATGGGKTEVIRALGAAAVDLERLASHRGSAFGAEAAAQGTFENALAVEVLRLENAAPLLPALVEDESRMIGMLSLPEIFFRRMWNAPVLLVEEPLADRVEHLARNYFKDSDPGTMARYRTAVKNISRKLGDERARRVLAEMDESERSGDHRPWMEALLKEYYDPMYRHALERRQPKVLFRGRRAEVESFLRSLPAAQF